MTHAGSMFKTLIPPLFCDRRQSSHVYFLCGLTSNKRGDINLKIAQKEPNLCPSLIVDIQFHVPGSKLAGAIP